jgi:hypothetical protein
MTTPHADACASASGLPSAGMAALPASGVDDGSDQHRGRDPSMPRSADRLATRSASTM